MKQRLVYIDRLKGFAIYLVVLGHIYQKMVVQGTETILFSMIYAFHMPLFFFLSGYISEKTNKMVHYKDSLTYLIKKAGNLLVPFMIWALLNYLLFGDQKEYTFNRLTTLVINQFSEPSLWFLLVLFKIFVAYVPFFLISMQLKKEKSLLLDIGLIAVTMFLVVVFAKIVHISGGVTFLLNYTFFMFGVLINRHAIVKEFLMKKWFYVVSIFCFVLFAYLYDFNLTNLIKMKAFKLVAALSAAVTFYNVAQRIKLPLWLDAFLSKTGKWTMVIYTTHFVFFYLIESKFFFPEKFYSIVTFLLVNVLTVLLIFMCILIGTLVKRLPILDFLLYGNIMKYNFSTFKKT